MAELSSIVDIEIRTDKAVRNSRKIVDNLVKIDRAQKKVKKTSKETSDSIEKSSKTLNSAAKKADTSIKKIGSSATKSKGQVKGFGSEAGRAAASLTRIPIGIAATIAAIGAAAIGAAIKFATFDQAIANLSAITGATGEDLKTLEDAARDMGKTTTLSASQVATAFQLVASAKPDLLANVEALKAVTRQTIILAEAAGIDLVESANAVGSSLNQFGAEADQASKFVNVLAAGSKFGASTISETAEALKTSGVAAANFGLSFEQANAAIQVFSQNAIKGSEAGTALRNILTKLETKMTEEFRPSVVGVVTALENLRDANLTTAEQTKLFGDENFVAGQILTQNIPKFKKLIEDLTDTNTAQEQASVRTGTLIGSLKGLGSALEELTLIITKDTGAGGAFQQFIDFVTDVTLDIGEFIKAEETAEDQTRRFAAESKRLVEVFSKLNKSEITEKMKELERQITQNKKVVKSFKDEMAGLLRGTSSFANARRATERFTKKGGELERQLKDLETALVDAKDEVKTHTEETQTATDQAAKFSEKTEAVITNLEEQLAALKRTDTEQAIYNALTEAGAEANTDAAEAIVAKVTELENEKIAIKNASEAEKTRAKEAATAAKDLAKEKKEIADTELEEQQERQEQFAEDLFTVRDSLADVFIDFAENGSDAFDNIFENFKNLIKRMIAEFVASQVLSFFGFGNVPLSVTGSAAANVFGGGGGITGGGGGFDTITDAATDIVEGFETGGFSGAFDAAGNIISGGVEGITEGFTNFIGDAANSLGLAGNAGLTNTITGEALAGPTQGNVVGQGGNALVNAGLNIAAGFAGRELSAGIVSAVGGKTARSDVGATIGGIVGGFVGGPLGTFIGATIGGLVDSVFGSGKGDPFSLFLSKLDLDGKSRKVKDNDAAGIISSPFGDFQFRTSRDLLKDQGQANSLFAAIDGLAALEAELASTLTPEQISAVTAALPSEFRTKTRKGVDIEGFFRNRFNIISAALGGTVEDVFGIPAFSHGGNHLGGLRLVGERGPEIEATGPSRIFSTRDLQTTLSGDDKEVVELLNRLLVLTKDIGVKSLIRLKNLDEVTQKWDQVGLKTVAA